jgi:ATP/maltotriose-dependent transcriptional regulator MalT
MARGGHQPDRPRLIATKFRAPARSGTLLTRQRLLEQLDGRRDRKLTLIHGPAGFGKTTLAIQWRERLQAQGAAVAWLSISRDDNALGRFLTYLVEAVRVGEPSITLDVTTLLEAKAEQAADIVVADLVNAFAAVERDVYLILDDWHLIHEHAVRDVVSFLLDHAPPCFHLVLTSRERPALPLARLRVDDQLTEIAASDLRFSVGESRAFLCDVNELSLDDGDVRSLWNSTEGWVAALQLALLSLRTAGDTAHSIECFSAKHHVIGEYLAENVLDHLPAEVLEFLLATSILDRLSGSLCAAVSGVADSQQMLEHLDKQDLFIQPLDEAHEWYRYHHLFASHLQRRLERSAPQRVAELHNAASHWFAEHGHTDEAVAHALSAGEPERAVELVERDAMWLVEHSYMSTLRGLVARLPAWRLHARPQLQLAIAWGHCLTHRAGDARVALDHAEAHLATQDLSPWNESVVEAGVVEACIRIYQDRMDGVEEMVQPSIERAASYRPWVVAVAANVLTYVYLHRFDYDAALRLQAWARPFQDRAQGPFSGIYGRCFAGIAAKALGRLEQGVDHFRDALGMANASIGRHSHAARLAEALLGQAMVEMNELDEAERLLDDSRALGLEGGVADFSIATYVSSSRLLAQRGDLAGAHAVLDEGEQTAVHLGFARLAAAVLCERVRLWVAAGDIDTATRLFGSCAADAVAGREVGPETTELLQLAQARLYRAQGRLGEALSLLRPMLEAAAAQRRRTFEVRVRIQLALALDAADEPAASRAMLAEALAQGLPAGMKRSFLDEGPPLTGLLAGLDDALVADGYSDAGWSRLRLPLAGLLALGVAEQAVRATPAVLAAIQIPAAGVLKDREAEILRLLERGSSNKEIARSLAIGVDTVKWYLKSIYAKLGVTCRAQAVYEARRNGALG